MEPFRLTKGAFFKYLLEIVTIFVGITISFLFEEWRDERNNTQLRREIIVSIITDIKEKRTELDGDKKTNDDLIALIKRSQVRMEIQKTLPADTVKELIRTMRFDYWFFGTSTPAYTSASSTGLWQTLPDSLKRELHQLYYADFGYLNMLVQKDTEYASHCQLNFLIPRGLLGPERITQEKVRKLAGDEEFISYLNIFLDHFRLTVSFIEQTQRDADRVLAHLKAYQESL